MNPAEREELAGLLPGSGDPVLPGDRLSHLEEHLIREITREAAPRSHGAPGTASARRPRRRRLTLIAVPLGTVAALLATVVSLGTNGQAGHPATDTAAVNLLNRIATLAAAETTTPVRDDQYVYTRTQGTQLVQGEGENIFRRSDWQPVDGGRDGLARVTVLSGPHADEGTYDMTLKADPNTTTYRELQVLPADPDTLYQRIWDATEGQAPTHEEAALEKIGQMLPTATLLPQVNATLYRTAAKIPGVTVVDNAKDAAGRPGIGLAFGSKDRDVWVFDKRTLTYLGSDEVAVLQVGVVDKPGQTPADPKPEASRGHGEPQAV